MEGPLSSSQRPGFLSGWLTDRKVVGGADTTSIQMPGGTMREQLGELGVQLASGGAASAIAKTTIAPFERTKILLQTSSLVEGVGGHRPYRGVVDALARIPREQGVTAFWRGNLTNISRVVPTYALRFMFFDQFRKLTSIGHDVSQPLPLSRQMAAGALSGSVTMLCTFPLDLLRTRMSAEVTAADAPRVYRGMYSSARRIVQTQGPSGLYQGIGISLFEIAPYLAISFGGYEYLKARLPRPAGSDAEGGDGRVTVVGLWSKLGCGWLAGLSASLTCYPADTVKRQLMLTGSAVTAASNSSTAPKTAETVRGCVARMYRAGGVRVFYRGCLINAVNSGPAAAITFVVNDLLRELLEL